MMCRFHVQTAGSSLTAQPIDNNVVRTTVQALAAVLGGTQSLHTNARDEALALPTAEAARLALRTQQILAYESGVTETPDPLAGSYYVESLTDQLEAAANDYLAEIEALGGTLAAIEAGYPAAPDPGSRVPGRSARSRTGDQVVVGRQQVPRRRDRTRRTLQHIDPEGERRQVERVRESPRRTRPGAPGRPRWTALESCARGDGQPAAARSSTRSRRYATRRRDLRPAARSSGASIAS